MAMNNGVMTMRPLDKGLAIEPARPSSWRRRLST
jgi:copper(I)-binding protein